MAGKLERRDGREPNSHQWLQAVVLWRSRSPLSTSYHPDTFAVTEQLRLAANRTSRELQRQRLGGIYAGGHYHDFEHSSDGTKLWVLDQEFSLPRGDSALVVMVDDIDRASVAVAAYAYISAEMPDRYWSKMWTSGDTTYMVRGKDTEALFLQALRSAPVVKAFLDGTDRR